MTDAEDDYLGTMEPGQEREAPEATRAASEMRAGAFGRAATAKLAENTRSRWLDIPDPRGARDAMIDDIRACVDKARELLTSLQALPYEDPCVDGEVLRLGITWAGQKYWYAAIRVAGAYWLTGLSTKTPQCVPWDDLVEWMASSLEPVTVERMAVTGSLSSL